MNRLATRLVLLLLLVLALLPSAQARDTIGKGDIVVVPLKGEVSEAMFFFLRRIQKEAESDGAAALVLDMNTYGGRLDSAEQITNLLNRAQIPTYTFINTNAGSAGALIALATKHIYMAPVSAIGAAAPVLSTGEDLPVTAKEKTISYWSALVRGSATRNGHNPDVGEAFMDKDKEVKIGERIVHAKGSLLTLNAQEATEVIDGKPLLAAGIVESIPQLIEKAGLKGDVVSVKPTGFERLALWLTALAPLLLLGGMVFAYLEFKIPGVGVPGVLAAICFGLFFLGHYFAGLAGWEVVALFALGVALVIAELLLAHSTIVLGLSGACLMLASILWAMMDRYPGQTFLPTMPMLRVPLQNLFIALVASMIVIALLARYLPRTSAYRRFILSADIPSGPSLSTPPTHAFHPAFDIGPGTQGQAITTLRPSGKAKFGDHIIDVVTEGDFIPAETAVAVVSTDGMRVVVKTA